MTSESPVSEEKGGRRYWGFVIWPVVAAMVYVLSVGPAYWAVRKDIFGHKVLQVYNPLFRVIGATPFQRGVGVYLHFWVPDLYRRDGTCIAPD